MTDYRELVRTALRRLPLTDAERADITTRYPPAVHFTVTDPDDAHKLAKAYPAACVMYHQRGESGESVYVAGQLILRTGMSLDDI